MMNIIVRDYFAGFKVKNGTDGWKYLAWPIIYFLFFLPAIDGYFDNPVYLLKYLSFGAPIIFILIAGVTHPMKLPKMMHLVPMTTEERKSYITKSVWFKIIFGIAVGAICITPVLLVGEMHISVWALQMYNFMTFAIISSRMGKSSNGSDLWRGVMMVIETIWITIISYLMLYKITYGTKNGRTSVEWKFALLSMLLSLFMTIYVVTDWKKRINEAIDYERSYSK